MGQRCLEYYCVKQLGIISQCGRCQGHGGEGRIGAGGEGTGRGGEEGTAAFGSWGKAGFEYGLDLGVGRRLLVGFQAEKMPRPNPKAGEALGEGQVRSNCALEGD